MLLLSTWQSSQRVFSRAVSARAASSAKIRCCCNATAAAAAAASAASASDSGGSGVTETVARGSVESSVV